MLSKLLTLSEELGGVKLLLYREEGAPLYVWSRERVEPGLVRQVSSAIRELVSVVREVGELLWEGEAGVYVLSPASRGHLLAVLESWKEVGFYRSALRKHFSKS